MASGGASSSASVTIGSYGNEMGTKTASQRKRAARKDKMSEEEKIEEKKKRTIGQYNQWLRIIHEMFIILPTDYYDSFKGIWEPPDYQHFLPNHVYHLVFNRNRAPVEQFHSRRTNQSQQGLKDTQASLQQLSKLQVPQGVGGSHQTETTSQELKKPESVCLYLEYKYLEHYTEETCTVPEWFTSEAQALEWDKHFLIRRGSDVQINWYLGIHWAKRSWPLPVLPPSGSHLTERVGDAVDATNMDVHAPMRPEYTHDEEGAHHWTRGPTRANPRHKWELWLPSLIIVIDWCAKHERSGKMRKWVSHIGGHFLDWMMTEFYAMSGHQMHYTVVGNGLYKFLFHHLYDEIMNILTLPASMDYWMRLRNESKLGDAFETLGAYLLFQDNSLAFMEYSATLFWLTVTWEGGFEHGQKQWEKVLQWQGESFKYPKKPNKKKKKSGASGSHQTEAGDTASGSHQTDAGGGQSSSSGLNRVPEEEVDYGEEDNEIVGYWNGKPITVGDKRRQQQQKDSHKKSNPSGSHQTEAEGDDEVKLESTIPYWFELKQEEVKDPDDSDFQDPRGLNMWRWSQVPTNPETFGWDLNLPEVTAAEVLNPWAPRGREKADPYFRNYHHTGLYTKETISIKDVGMELTMNQCALYTKTIALGRKTRTGPVGQILPAMIIENRELAKSKAWDMLVKHKGVRISKAEEQELLSMSSPAPIMPTQLQFSHAAHTLLKDGRETEDYDAGMDDDYKRYSVPIKFVKGETLEGSIKEDGQEGSGSHQTEAASKHLKCTITPMEALTGPPKKKIKDEMYPGVELTDEQREKPWNWLFVQATGEELDEVIPLLYRRLKEMRREGRLPVWLTPAAVDDAREQIAYHKTSKEYKARGQWYPKDREPLLDHRAKWLEEHWIPFIEGMLKELGPDRVATAVQIQMDEAYQLVEEAQKDAEALLKAREEGRLEPGRFLKEARARRARNKLIFSTLKEEPKSFSGPKKGLRWVLKRDFRVSESTMPHVGEVSGASVGDKANFSKENAEKFGKA